MKLQKATSFALYAVLELAANSNRALSGTEIAAKYGISAHHLAKVLRDLGRARIVEAARGVGGGYRLIANPKRVTLLDIVQIFEPVASQPGFRGGSEAGTDAERALRIVLNELDEHTIATFRSITLSTMLKLMARKPWEHAARSPRAMRRAASLP
jgi:Rrf2 family nitric oxide-sensitive transcriptional repressor